MNQGSINRKIAVIFVADVVGYSKHMEKDETATFKAYGECEKILNKLLKQYKGSIFNTAGDSVLAEFPSAVNAVECGVNFQNDIKKRNQLKKTEVKLEFRIGINMGDVVMKDGNLLGDGVNIAARLEALAQPNGISISKSVYDFVVQKTKITFNDLGVQKVKQNTFHAYDILLDPSQKRKMKSQSSFSMPMLAGVAAVVIILLGGMFYFNQNNQPVENNKEKIVRQDSLPIILIMPFNSLGDDDNSVSNALTESLITSLSQYKGINVLSSSTSFFSKMNNLNDDQIKNEFNVDYTIRGSVQAFGQNNRLTLELNDLLINKVVWSDKVDFKLDDIFKVQDEIGFKILEELQVNAVVGQQAKRWKEEFDTFEKYTLFLNWRREWRKFSQDGYDKSLQIINRLKELNTNQNVIDYTEGWQTYQNIEMNFYPNLEEDLKELDKITMRLINNKGDNDSYALRAQSEMSYLSKDCEVAKNYLNKAMELGGSVDIFTISASVFEQCDNRKKGDDLNKSIEYSYKALELMPNDNGQFVTIPLVMKLILLERYDEIINLIQDVIDNEDIAKHPWRRGTLWIYAASLSANGDYQKAEKYFLKGKEYGIKVKSLVEWDEELFMKMKPHLEKLGTLE